MGWFSKKDSPQTGRITKKVIDLLEGDIDCTQWTVQTRKKLKYRNILAKPTRFGCDQDNAEIVVGDYRYRSVLWKELDSAIRRWHDRNAQKQAKEAFREDDRCDKS